VRWAGKDDGPGDEGREAEAVEKVVICVAFCLVAVFAYWLGIHLGGWDMKRQIEAQERRREERVLRNLMQPRSRWDEDSPVN
jgi:hypothetical protein